MRIRRALNAVACAALMFAVACRAVLGLHAVKLREDMGRGSSRGDRCDAGLCDGGGDLGDGEAGLPGGGGEKSKQGGGGNAGDASSGGMGGAAGDDGSGGAGGDGAAVDPECQDGELQCAGSAQRQVQRCKSGRWIVDTMCGDGDNCDSRAGATEGTCLPIAPECAGREPDSLVCVSTEVHRCGPDLVSISAVACTDDTPACAGGHCVECNAPEPALLCADASTPRACSSKYRWVNQPACSDPTPNCLEGGCVELCVSGEKRCSNNIPQSCVNQSWRNEVACSGDHPECDQGACVECKDPAPDLLCNGATPRTCVEGTWQNAPACAGTNSTQTCTAGQCKVVTCSLDWGDCNGLPEDGCEHDVSADAQNCGMCRNACSSGLCASNRCLMPHSYGFLNGTTDDAFGAGMLFGIPLHIAGDGILTGLGAIMTATQDTAHIYIGLYDTLATGEPRRLVQSTSMLTLKAGVNEASVAQTSVNSGDYWIVWITDGLGYFATNGGTINLRNSSYTFGSLPTQFNGTLGMIAAPPPDLYAIVAQ